MTPSVELNPNLPVSLREVAAVEFVVRCAVSSPLKQWFKAKHLASHLPLSASQVGAALGAMVQAGADDLVLDQRPGGRGGAVVGIARVRDDVDERRWWVEAGTRTSELPTPASPSPATEPERSPRQWWIERGAVNQEAVPA